mmetsp:Transcript_84168/g.241950  ORF Transcript_84168/g.241950 Transcript_84168/m.241950 type:complete len:231 (-) Transcript_84168:1548-2240(-)
MVHEYRCLRFDPLGLDLREAEQVPHCAEQAAQASARVCQRAMQGHGATLGGATEEDVLGAHGSDLAVQQLVNSFGDFLQLLARQVVLALAVQIRQVVVPRWLLPPVLTRDLAARGARADDLQSRVRLVVLLLVLRSIIVLGFALAALLLLHPFLHLVEVFGLAQVAVSVAHEAVQIDEAVRVLGARGCEHLILRSKIQPPGLQRGLQPELRRRALATGVQGPLPGVEEPT